MSTTKTSDKPRGAIVQDPEVIAMSKIAGLLANLEPEVRDRVVNWINAKYNPATRPSPEKV